MHEPKVYKHNCRYIPDGMSNLSFFTSILNRFKRRLFPISKKNKRNDSKYAQQDQTKDNGKKSFLILAQNQLHFKALKFQTYIL